MAAGYQPIGGEAPALPTTGSGVKAPDAAAAERDRLARLVEGMINQAPQDIFGKPSVRMALAIAASNVRRGRYLTDREKLLNLAKGLEETIGEERPEDVADNKALVARLRKAAGVA